ncbi:MAG: CRISPR-associated endonuclease Cas2 [Gammaproteobacteria bacterium]
MEEHLYIVAYDISDQKRWRKVFKLMNGYGDWVQLSLFQCRLSKRRHVELLAMLSEIIHHRQDHVVVMDLGVADRVNPRINSLGKPFDTVEREVVIV